MLYSIETQNIMLIVLVVALVGVLVVMPIFTNKKRAKTINDLHGNLKTGDKIMTIGGIIGTVKAINQISPVDKEIVIETGLEGSTTTMVLDIKALYQVIPPAGSFAMPVNAEPVEDVNAAELAEPFDEVIAEPELTKNEEESTEE